MVSVTIRPDDPRLVAIKAELLHGIPELTGKKINRVAFLALVAIDKMELNQQKATSSSLVLSKGRASGGCGHPRPRPR
jgi:hypothetical protein